MKKFKVIGLWLLLALSLTFTSCRKAEMPRPYGYYRITMPEVVYEPLQASYPFTFEQSQAAQIMDVSKEKGIWFNIHYPTLNADIHCSYYPVQGNLRVLTDDAMEFLHKHISQATAIPSQDYANEQAHVYGALFTVEGNTASPYQFFVTDSTDHFLRGAVYCNCQPNVDSLRPVLDYLYGDVIHLMETLQWK